MLENTWGEIFGHILYEIESNLRNLVQVQEKVNENSLNLVCGF